MAVGGVRLDLGEAEDDAAHQDHPDGDGDARADAADDAARERRPTTITARVAASCRTPAWVAEYPCTFCMKRARKKIIPKKPKLTVQAHQVRARGR